jgi:hypothetical protein
MILQNVMCRSGKSIKHGLGMRRLKGNCEAAVSADRLKEDCGEAALSDQRQPRALMPERCCLFPPSLYDRHRSTWESAFLAGRVANIVGIVEGKPISRAKFNRTISHRSTYYKKELESIGFPTNTVIKAFKDRERHCDKDWW